MKSVMRFSVKKFAQGAAAVILFICYGTLMIAWGTRNAQLTTSLSQTQPLGEETNINLNLHLNSPYVGQFQERAPRSVAVDNNNLEDESFNVQINHINHSPNNNINNNNNNDDVQPNSDYYDKQTLVTNSDKKSEIERYYYNRIRLNWGKLNRNQLSTFPLSSSPLSQQQQQLASPSKTNLKDIFISVKTTKSFHDVRLNLLLRTWFLLAKEQVIYNAFKL